MNKLSCPFFMVLIVCFDLGFQISNPVIKYRPNPSCMSYMEARAEMPPFRGLKGLPIACICDLSSTPCETRTCKRCRRAGTTP